jgi:signal transduction histidine kinase
MGGPFPNIEVGHTGLSNTTLQDPAIRTDTELAEAALLAINEEVERLERLVANVLHTARADSGTLQVTLVPCDLHALITQTVSRFQGRSRHHQFVAAVPDPLPPVLGDREYLASVLYNLLANALKYAPQGGQVTVRAQVQDETVAGMVADEGPGIAPEHLTRIFEPYYRAPQVGRQTDGLGLGLYISRAIMVAHGGRMWAESQVGHGTQIHFTIPAIREALQQDELA